MSYVFPGDEIDGKYKVERLVAYRGKEGCNDLRCTRKGPPSPDNPYGECFGWHCSLCDEPTSMMGHDCPKAIR